MNTHHRRRRSTRRARSAVVTAVTGLVAALVLAQNPAATGHAATTASDVDGWYDVGGHDLYLTCRGSGSPTVIYLHGAIFNPAIVPHRNAFAIRDRLDDQMRVCLYDRRNLGLSDSVDKIQQPKDMVRDLERLLTAAEIRPPYVLLGASFGGVLGYVYAAQHPGQVVGMVNLDSMIPDELDLEKYWPREERFKAYHREDMFDTPERLSHWRMLETAYRYIGREPKIPLTYVLAGQDPWDQTGVPEYDAQIGQLQANYVGRFSPGRIVSLDAPHFMEPVVPDEIAALVLDVVAQARS